MVLWNVPNGTFWYFGSVPNGTFWYFGSVPNGTFWYFGMFQKVLFWYFGMFQSTMHFLKKIAKNQRYCTLEWCFLVLWNVSNGTFWYFSVLRMFQRYFFDTFWYFEMIEKDESTWRVLLNVRKYAKVPWIDNVTMNGFNCTFWYFVTLMSCNYHV